MQQTSKKVTGPFEKLTTALIYLLPQGLSLPAEVWERRHRAILALLWAHVVGIVIFGLIAAEQKLAQVAPVCGVIALAALLAGWSKLNRRMRTVATSLGLVISSSLLVYLSGGYIELHFHFFVMVAVIALYQDWIPFLLAVAYVVAEHGIIGVLDPRSVYNHPDAWANPWKWALIHGVFVVGECIACIVYWRSNEGLYAHSQLVLGSAGEGICGMDAQGRLSFMNVAGAKMLGWKAEELTYRPIHEVLFGSLPNDITNWDDLPIYKALNNGTEYQSSNQLFTRKNGTSFSVEYVSNSIWEHGKVTGAVLTFNDITERKRTEEAVSFERDMLHSLMESMPDSIYFKDKESKFIRINPSVAEAVGLADPDEAVGKSDFDFFSEQLARMSYDDEQEIIRTGKPIMGKEEREVWPDGHETWVLTTKMPLRDAEGSIIGTFGVSRDISERKNVDRMKNEFVSTVSHELRTPLTSIRGSLGLIAGGVAGEIPAQAKAMVDIAYNNSERLVRLINDILDIEKIESGKMVFDIKPIELMPLVKQAIEANCGYGEQFDVALLLKESVPNAMVNADSDRLIQVLTNLLSNAAKFSPRYSKVEVSVTRVEGNMRLAFTDYGPGIPEEFRGQIFQKFAQADSSDTRQKGGTGLGLSITKAIVERFGGHIYFETTTGEGTTFYVDLPEVQPEPQDATDINVPGTFIPHAVNDVVIPGTLQSSNGRPPVLICEDDEDIATLLSIMLERGGFSSEVARDAAHAKSLMSEKKYAALTLDLMLPDQDGISLIKELCDEDGQSPTPIVVVSANAEDGKRDLNGYAFAVMDWLSKPIDYERLVAAVRRASSQSEGKPQILHVEDDHSILKVVTTLLENVADISTASTLREARSSLSKHHFDLVLLDLSLPDGSGLELLPHLNGSTSPPTPVVLFSAHDVEAETTRKVSAALVKARTSNQQLVDTITSLIRQEETTMKV